MHAMFLFFFVCRAQYYTYVANINTLLYIHFCLLFFGLMYSTMPDCIEHLIAFFSVHCSILYSVLFYRVRCWVDDGVPFAWMW